MEILYSRDLLDRREVLQELLLSEFNEKFGERVEDFTDISKVCLKEENFLEYFEGEYYTTIAQDDLDDFFYLYEDEYDEIKEIDNMETSDFQYGVDLILEEDFVDYAEEFIGDCGYIPKDFPDWIVIDWEATADNLKANYTCVTYKGKDYLCR
jgi:hypothetical protein